MPQRRGRRRDRRRTMRNERTTVMHDDEGTDGNNSLTMTKIRVIPTKTEKATHTAAVKTVTKRAATTIDDLDLQKTLKLLVMTHISADVLVLSAPFKGGWRCFWSSACQPQGPTVPSCANAPYVFLFHALDALRNVFVPCRLHRRRLIHVEF